MLKETKNTMQEIAFEEIKKSESASKRKAVEIFLNTIFRIINKDVVTKEINLVYIGTFKMQKREKKLDNQYYVKIEYSRKLRNKIKSQSTQDAIQGLYGKYGLKVVAFNEIVEKVCELYEDADIYGEQLKTMSFVLVLLDAAYKEFYNIFYDFLIRGYMIDMGIKILHIGKNKKFGFVLSQKNKQAQLIALNKRISDIKGGNT